MWIEKPFFRYATAAILLLLIIFLLGKIDYFVWPFKKLIATIFLPMLLSGFLYYILRPLVRLLEKFMPTTPSILAVFLFIFAIGFAFFHFAGPKIAGQVKEISSHLPSKVAEVTDESKKLVEDNEKAKQSVDNIQSKAKSMVGEFFKAAEKNIGKVVSAIAGIVLVLSVVPFIVFYLLRDGERLQPALLRHLPTDRKDEGRKILRDIDKTLSSYIIGQFIIAVADGIMLYAGYLLIGLDNALLLALFAMCVAVVPFLGPIIGIIPAVFIALMDGPGLVIKVLLVMFVVQQLEGNLITPRVMSNKLNLHPLTVILVLLVAGSLYGAIGVIISIPLFSVLKVTFNNIRKFYNLKKIKKAI
ncbi:AI-2E family transporter [Neobacillus piezotolerans]|uniref:AI-2E family transporter n=1 Tax=Neobacillus piezotolerans TaxID=2259171 RepID=A0A3D8GWG4_9BACI|nr:AI-2E family transporter [Neobacillus piezotolerans]RDU38785.1 AI-2E family transporter [Neobacillus piezotolerans]